MAKPRARDAILTRKLLWTILHAQSPHLPKRLRIALAIRLGSRRRRQAVLPGSTPGSTGAYYHDNPDMTLSPFIATFFTACKQGDAAQVKRLLSHHHLRHDNALDHVINHQHPETGETPLAVACACGRTDVVQLLLAAGASAYIFDNNEVSPLMKASQGGHVGAVTALLVEGSADPFHLSSGGRTALMEAAVEGHVRVVKALMSQGGADARQSDESGSGTHALLEAAGAGQLDVVKALLANPSPNPNASPASSPAPSPAQSTRARINQTDKIGNTALLLAARLGDSGMVKFLLHAGAKSIATFDTKRTPLMEAACCGFLPVVTLLLNKATKAELQATDAQGHRAVDLAGRPAVRAAIKAAMDKQ